MGLAEPLLDCGRVYPDGLLAEGSGGAYIAPGRPRRRTTPAAHTSYDWICRTTRRQSRS